jgi:hypothetical protein
MDGKEIKTTSPTTNEDFNLRHLHPPIASSDRKPSGPPKRGPPGAGRGRGRGKAVTPELEISSDGGDKQGSIVDLAKDMEVITRAPHQQVSQESINNKLIEDSARNSQDISTPNRGNQNILPTRVC